MASCRIQKTNKKARWSIKFHILGMDDDLWNRVRKCILTFQSILCSNLRWNRFLLCCLTLYNLMTGFSSLRCSVRHLTSIARRSSRSPINSISRLSHLPASCDNNNSALYFKTERSMLQDCLKGRFLNLKHA